MHYLRKKLRNSGVSSRFRSFEKKTPEFRSLSKVAPDSGILLRNPTKFTPDSGVFHHFMASKVGYSTLETVIGDLEVSDFGILTSNHTNMIRPQTWKSERSATFTAWFRRRKLRINGYLFLCVSRYENPGI